ncbi:MAG: hypothetical protein HW414_1298, partial [Dehalococcoidia bacterium]|nr:hypothetical protein [Dehalococcoidia bacterium]
MTAENPFAPNLAILKEARDLTPDVRLLSIELM